MREVGALIAEVLHHIADEDVIAAVRQRVDALTAAFPALPLEAATRCGPENRRMALHIVIDARRIRDFGIGTYIRSLVHALGAHRSDQPLHSGQRAGGRAHAGGAAGEFRLRRLRARRSTAARQRRRSRCFCAASRPTWCTFR